MLYPTELRARVAPIAALCRSCQRRWWLTGLAFLLLPVSAGGAEEASRVERIWPVPVIRLADGVETVLASVIVPPELTVGATDAVSGWLAAGRYTLESMDTAADRHGHRRVALVRGGRTLQHLLVGDGLAIVAPEQGVQHDLLPLEVLARRAKRGLWATGEHGPFEADEVPPAEGRYLLIEGRIARIARASIYWYANFGESYRRDFTFRVPRTEERAFAAAGLDLAGLERRRVRVRGWLFEENGPMIEITHPLALEVLE